MSTVEEVAAALKVTRKAVYDLMRANRLPYVQIGVQRGRRIRRSALDAFLKGADRNFTGSGDQGYNPKNALMPTLGAA